jgi:hypothetical protein
MFTNKFDINKNKPSGAITKKHAANMMNLIRVTTPQLANTPPIPTKIGIHTFAIIGIQQKIHNLQEKLSSTNLNSPHHLSRATIFCFSIVFNRLDSIKQSQDLLETSRW